MRQSYQANSYQNELMGPDLPRSVQTPNCFYSSPTSPKVIHFPSSTPLPTPSPLQYREGSSRTVVKVEPNDYNMRRREKLAVTTSNKRRH